MDRKIVSTFFCAALFLAAFMTGCSGVVIAGSGVKASEAHELAEFTSIEFSGQGDVLLVQTDDHTLTIEADDNILPLLKSEVSDGVLKLWTDTGKPAALKPQVPIRYEIGFEKLEELDISGAGNFRCDKLKGKEFTISLSGAGDIGMRLDLAKLTARISGAGEVELTGKAGEQDIKVSGAGEWNGRELKSDAVTIGLTGAANAAVNVTSELVINISGVGTVAYIGDPEVTQSVSGMGVVKKLAD